MKNQQNKIQLSYSMEAKEITGYNLSILIAGALVILPMAGFIVGFLVSTLIQ